MRVKAGVNYERYDFEYETDVKYSFSVLNQRLI